MVAFRRLAQLVLLLVSCLAPAAAQVQRPADVPPELWQIFEEERAQCRAEGGRFVADPTGFYETANFNGDNRPDYIVSMAGLHCSAFGYSAYCGSAGCVQRIFLSQGNQLREIWSGNLQAGALSALPDGRQALVTGMHGSACGRTGADTCFVAMSWNGRAWTSSRLNREPPELAAAIARENAPPPSMPPWEAHAGSLATGPVALLRGHPQIPLALVRCIEGVPVVTLRLGANSEGRDLPLPPTGRQLILAIGGDDQEQLIRLDPIAEAREFAGAISPQAYALLAGAGSDVELRISIAEGEYWLPADSLSLAGSTAALRPVAAACAGQAPRSADAATPAAAPGQAVGPLNIVAGHYVTEGVACSAPEFEVFYYDGRRIGLLRDDERFVEPVGRVTRSGSAFVLRDWEMAVTRLSPTRIQREIQDTGPPERWCPADQIPAAYRMR